MVDDDIPNAKKRKADVLSRLAESSNTAGRGALSGWTTCPLCGDHSRKRYALGRGIASHLHASHTPWRPGKVELKKQRRLNERREMDQRKQMRTTGNVDPLHSESSTHEEVTQPYPVTWDPTPDDEERWAQRVLDIVAELEAKARDKIETSGQIVEFVKAGLDRDGKQSQTYRQSLPHFIQAAADGDLSRLQEMLNRHATNHLSSTSSRNYVRELLDTRDRNGSTAEHWAAGGGHLACLQLLLKHRERHFGAECKLNEKHKDASKKKTRRRDGKTCLHYAARNGQLSCVQFLVDNGHAVDQASGDGTTPLHMACYGGHMPVVKLLMKYGADIHAVNEWGCGSAHWVGMTQSKITDQVRDLCSFLHENSVSFFTPQKQGHSALHKAAQRRNRHVIEWMMQTVDQGGAGLSLDDLARAGKPDLGGHTPSEIWRSVGGEDDFAECIRVKFGYSFNN